MKRTESESIGNLIRQVMREQGLESPLNEYRLIQAWAKVLGPAINAYTKNLYIRNQTLYVQLSSPALRQELMMQRTRLVDRLNQQVGAQVITSINFH